MMAKKTAVPPKTPPVVKGGKGPKNKFDETMYQRGLFLSMALNMSWQLAAVVIIPIVGGYKLDQRMDSSPLYTLIGFAVALLGSAAVLYRVVAEAQRRTGYGRENKK